jgi:hypothetical protein
MVSARSPVAAGSVLFQQKKKKKHAPAVTSTVGASRIFAVSTFLTGVRLVLVVATTDPARHRTAALEWLLEAIAPILTTCPTVGGGVSCRNRYAPSRPGQRHLTVSRPAIWPVSDAWTRVLIVILRDGETRPKRRCRSAAILLRQRAWPPQRKRRRRRTSRRRRTDKVRSYFVCRSARLSPIYQRMNARARA